MEMFSPTEIALNHLENAFQDVQIPPSDDDNQNAMNHQKMDTSDSDMAYRKTDLSNLKVTVGIDEDLQMILEMDPSIVDLVRSTSITFTSDEPFLARSTWSQPNS